MGELTHKALATLAAQKGSLTHKLQQRLCAENVMNSNDPFVLGGINLGSRLFIGTGKYGADGLIPAVAQASGAEVITVAMRRVDKPAPAASDHSASPNNVAKFCKPTKTRSSAASLLNSDCSSVPNSGMIMMAV